MPFGALTLGGANGLFEYDVSKGADDVPVVRGGEGLPAALVAEPLPGAGAAAPPRAGPEALLMLFSCCCCCCGRRAEGTRVTWMPIFGVLRLEKPAPHVRTLRDLTLAFTDAR